MNGVTTAPRPLAAEDDMAAFDCGREALNQWLRRHAWRNQELGVSRTSVICDPATGDLIGFVSLSAAQIERAWLPKAQQPASGRVATFQQAHADLQFLHHRREMEPGSLDTVRPARDLRRNGHGGSSPTRHRHP